jgi:uncharacterized protein (TIGR02145 family)
MKKNHLQGFLIFCLILFLIITSTCNKIVKSISVRTVEVTNITTNTADASGEVVDLGDGATQYGHCYSTTANPSITGIKTELGIPAAGGFTSQLTGLTAGTRYYIKAYLSNGEVTVYGQEISFSTTAASLPSVTTTTISSITSASATCGGNITIDGGTSVTVRGVCWNTASGPSINNSKTTDGNGTGIFVSSLTNLSPGTIYYVRAYATNSIGTSYGEELSFSTEAVISTLTTAVISSITATNCICGGNITSDGGADVISRGVCWSSLTGPTIGDSKTSDGAGTGSFISQITSLNPGKKYYVRAYATNISGTAYGNELSFTTESTVPSVTTSAVSSITSTTAVTGGNVTNDNGSSVTERGVCWATSTNPTTANSKTTNGTGTGEFTSSMADLTENTNYYVRAYATNSRGTSYGEERSFTTGKTPTVLPTVTTTIITAITSSGAVSGGNITSDGGATVTTRGVCWSKTANPTTSDTRTEDGTGSGSYTSTIEGLNPGTIYHLRAYATNSDGTAYGDDLTFTTNPVLPTVTTLSISGITVSTASCGGNVTNEGGANVTARGVCWSTSSNPTTSDPKTSDGTGSGEFFSSLTGLASNTKHYIRAYATNSAGTAYGNELSFSTNLFTSSPTALTSAATLVTEAGATVNGIVNPNNIATSVVFEYGTSTSYGQTINATPDLITGNINESVSADLTGLTSRIIYHFRVKASSLGGITYGNDMSFSSAGPTGTITDTDGNIYTTIQLNDQVWMAENLKTIKYNDGTPIPRWSASSTPGYCWYFGDTIAHKNTYGGLYNWFAVSTGKLCPAGWHVPSDAEWTALSNYLTTNGYGFKGIAGGIAKSLASTSGWAKSENAGAVGNDQLSNNASGFTALPGGYRLYNGTFYFIGYYGYWWSSTESDPGINAWFRYMFYDVSSVYRNSGSELNAFSIRCLKN